MKTNTGTSIGHSSRLAFAFALMIITSSLCEAKSRGEKYLVTTSGNRINITRICYLSADSVFYQGELKLSYLPIDSIGEYHHHAPGRAGIGAAIGAGAGFLAGILIGAAAAPPVDYSNAINGAVTTSENALSTSAGALIGVLVGGGVGALIGSSKRRNVNISFAGRTLQSKQEIILSFAEPK